MSFAINTLDPWLDTHGPSQPLIGFLTLHITHMLILTAILSDLIYCSFIKSLNFSSIHFFFFSSLSKFCCLVQSFRMYCKIWKQLVDFYKEHDWILIWVALNLWRNWESIAISISLSFHAHLHSLSPQLSKNAFNLSVKLCDFYYY